MSVRNKTPHPEESFLPAGWFFACLCFCRNLVFSLPQIDNRKDDRKCKQQYAYDLRRGKTEQEASDLIASEKFIYESDDRICKEIHDEKALGKLVFLI